MRLAGASNPPQYNPHVIIIKEIKNEIQEPLYNSLIARLAYVGAKEVNNDPV
jgi:hypothetical protein